MPPGPGSSAAIETTGYATLALLARGDQQTAAKAARWLVSRRNAYGGFGSTQDTVVGLQALAAFAASSKADVDATVKLRAGGWTKEQRVDATSADVMQTVELPSGVGDALSVEVAGRGQVVLQTVRRFSVPAVEAGTRPAFEVKVDYGTASVAVDDLIDIRATIRYTPPEPVTAGMVVVDIAVPTGFAAETATLDKLVGTLASGGGARVKRYDVAGRKVSVYLEDMRPSEEARLAFKARALFPVRAQAVASKAYSYYRPELQGESLGGAVVVN
jgi:CD109 antigen